MGSSVADSLVGGGDGGLGAVMISTAGCSMVVGSGGGGVGGGSVVGVASVFFSMVVVGASSSLFGVLKRRSGCCLAGGLLAGSDWRHSPVEGTGLDLRLALSPTDSTLQGLFFACSTLSVGWSVGSLYVSSILTWSSPSPIRHSSFPVN